ncbi:DUF1499 domain-containing protein [Candidatus Raskinella chloraquaticus]
MTMLTFGRAWTLAPQRSTHLAVWSRRFGTLSVPMAVFGVVFHRAGAADGDAGIAVLGAFVACALLGLVCGVLALMRIWTEGYDGARFAMIGIIWSLAVLVIPATLLPAILTLPHLRQATTDFDDPPAFNAALRDHPVDGRAAGLLPPQQKALQSEAYPTVVPLRIDVSAPEAFALALQIAESNGWRIIERKAPEEILTPAPGRAQRARPTTRSRTAPRPPAPEQEARRPADPNAIKDYTPGIIEAVARTRFYGFRDDVVIRITAMQRESRIDMRSASRSGSFDLGTNARRIVDFLAELRDRAAER